MHERAISIEKLTYPCWSGSVICILCPGLVHILSGQIRNGICWYFSAYWILISAFFTAALPINGMGWLSISIVAVFYMMLAICSYRPVRRIGCVGGLALLLLIYAFNFIVNSALGYAVKKYAVETFSIVGQSMAPTLLAPSMNEPAFDVTFADRVITNKWIFLFRSPQRAELVTHYTGESDNSGKPVSHVKRIVGLPGETVDIASPFVLINGQKLTEPPIFTKIASQKNGYSGFVRLDEFPAHIHLPITLGDDEYFLLGDNSPISQDSRFTGAVKRKDITGKVIRIYYPFERAGLVR